MTAPDFIHVPGFPDTAAARAKLDETMDRTFGHGFTPGTFDRETEMIRVLEERPFPRDMVLTPDFKGSQADALNQHARTQGFDLVQIDMHERRAYAAQLSPETRAIRKRLAAYMKTDPWNIEVAVETTGTQVDQVQILRAPEVGTDPEKVHNYWVNALSVLPGGHPDWLVGFDMVSGRVVLTNREPLSLPKMVQITEIIPETLNARDWASVNLGIGPDGLPVGFDLKLGPHCLLVGPTGSGKTVSILSLLTSNILHGHDIAIIDPTKGGLDFASLRPYCVGFADDYDSSIALITAVYEEGQRRKQVLKEHMEVKWSDLDESVRERESIRPLTVVVDELFALMKIPTVPKGLEKDHPLVVKANALIAAKSIISETVQSIARELRFVGVHLIVATQRPDANTLGGEFRSNLTSVAQLAKPGKLPARAALGMVFEGEEIDEAAQTIKSLDDGRTIGLGVAAGDGGDLVAFRVAYSPMKELPAILDARGARRVEPWALDLDAQRDPLKDIALPDAFDGFDDGGFDNDPWGDPQPAVATGGGGGFAPSLDDLFT